MGSSQSVQREKALASAPYQLSASFLISGSVIESIILPRQAEMAKLVGRMSKTSAKGADQKEYGRACFRILIS